MLVPKELFTAFNDVTYYDEPHKYYHNNNQFISVTTLIHKYQEPFNEDYWSQVKADKYGLNTYEIKRIWKFINKKGTLKGSIVHDYAENTFLNKKFEYPQKIVLNEFGFDPIHKEYEISKKQVDNFYNDSHEKLIPIRTEFVVRDVEAMIAGMLDILFWNVKEKCFQIWDWKSNKDFTFETKRRLIGDLFLLDDSDLTIYSLQLQMYKYIIEKYIPIKLGDSYIVWYSQNNDNYRIIKTKDMSRYIDIIVNNRLNEKKSH